eukprot:151244-Amphidinium_carterae.1
MLDKATAVVTATFTEIGVDFQPSALSGTEATLTIKANAVPNVAYLQNKSSSPSEKGMLLWLPFQHNWEDNHKEAHFSGLI